MEFLPEGPIVVAHRGASSTHAENTLAAFDAAMDVGADAVECDVRRTADGVAVIMHDPDVSSTTDGSGLVHEMTLEELRRLDASGGGERLVVPTLAEVAERLRIGLNLEIKNIPGEPSFDSPEESVLRAALAELDGFDGPVLISSFNWLTIERCRELAPGIPTGFLTPATIDPRAALLYAREAGHGFILPQVPALLEAGEVFVREAHAAGVRVGTWTVDDPATMETLFGWGVDAVATNVPSAGVAARDRAAR